MTATATALYTSSTRTFTSTRRAIGKCKVCKATHRAVARFEVTETQTWGITGGKTRRNSKLLDGREDVFCCGQFVALKRIEGHQNETPCDERCTEAKGHKCECSCGGRNHGAGHDAA